MVCYATNFNQIESARGNNPGSCRRCIAALAGFLFGDPAMKRIPLTQGKYALVDDEDYDWLMTWKWCAHKKKYGGYYAVVSYPDFMSMHQLLLMHPVLGIDHGDHNGLNNQKYNIRACTQRENMQNSSRLKTSRFIGVSWNKQYRIWISQIRLNNIPTYLGRYLSEERAAFAYRLMEIQEMVDNYV